MKKLPPEIIRHILKDLPPSSLKVLRLCWRFLEPFTLPRLFHTIKVNFAEKHIKKLQGISLSPHIAPLVQQLIWITSGTRDTHDDPHGHVNTWTGHEDYIKEFRGHFFLSLDAMPNLHTFASELGPLGLHPERDQIDGLVYALWPAMRRRKSRITSFRCQDPLNYMRWLNCECLQAMGGQHTELPASFPAGPLRGTVDSLFSEDLGLPTPISRREFLKGLIMTQFPMVGLDPTSIMVWRWPLRKFRGLDLRIDSAGGHWKGTPSPETNRTYSRPNSHSNFAMFPTSKPFVEFMEGHAETLKHILIHGCTGGNKSPAEIIKAAAKAKKLKLHRFLVFPSQEGYLQDIVEPWIIPERLVLDFVNKKDPSLDPFKEYLPGRDCVWGTVTQKAASISEEWPKDDGMHFTCRQCTNQV
ncbi:hypothetical protein NCS55_00378500 [Fusarium keratoplasticum]|nr:hypothetical protein NCS55_00378500 [Fusarium keratoplasticum]